MRSGWRSVKQTQRCAIIAHRSDGPFAAKRRTEIRVQHLDGDIALVLEIVREVNGGHAAGTEFTLDAIAVGERRR